MLRPLRVWGTEVADELVVDLVGMLRRAGYDSTAAKLRAALTWGRPETELTERDAECLFRVLDEPPLGLVELRAALLMDLEDPPGTVLSCTECECVSRTGPGWVAVIVDDPDDPGPPGIATYCPPCAARVLEYLPRAGVYT
jgi:hypothetical protein